MEKNKNKSELEILFADAVNLHQSGESSKACKFYRLILKEIPDSPLVHYNLALALFECGHYEKSCNHYRKALDQAPENVDVLFNLALVLNKLGKLEEAIATYENILSLQPGDIDSLYNIACAYKDDEDYANALRYYEQVLTLDPTHLPSINNIAFIHHICDDLSSARKYYALLLQLNPKHVAAKHMLSSIEGESLSSADPRYVAEVFDAYSSNYDASLVEKLSYSVPQAMRAHFNEFCQVTGKSLRALDLGCGTGLGAQAFCDICTSIDGIDISPKMVQIADKKNIYTSLYVDEIAHYLEKCETKYDLILATDVFTYSGGLENIFSLVYRIMEKSTFFCFSTEKLENEGYVLRPSGRFAHSIDYIKSISRSIGFTDTQYLLTRLRKEKDSWVEGVLYFLRK